MGLAKTPLKLSQMPRRWRQRLELSTNRRIFAAFVTVGFVTLLVKLAAAGKELVVAYQFGTSDDLDAFLIAYLVPSLATTVVAGSIVPAFIPTYVEVRERHGPEQANELLGTILFNAIIFFFLVCTVLAVSISHLLPILGSGFGDAKLATTQSLFFVVLPTVAITGVAMIWTSVLQAGERFALAAMVPLVTPIAVIVALFAIVETWGIYALATSILFGALIEVALLAFAVRRLGIPVRPRWKGLTQPVRQVGQQYMPMIAGALLMGATFVVDQSMAAMLAPGSVAAFNYGSKIVFLIQGVVAGALGSVILPHFSKMVAKARWHEIGEVLKSYGSLIVAIGIPTSLMLIYFSEPLTGLLFERGQFTAQDTELVAKVQLFYSPQLTFYVLSTLMVRLISSLKANKILMWVAGISLVTNVVLNYTFMRWIGLPGIALSTSVVYALSTTIIAIALRGLLKRKNN